MKKQNKSRLIYLLLFSVFLAIEVLIALYVRDSFIRPYVGDAIVTVLICSFVRIIFPEKIKFLPLYVCAFAFAVEIGQYFDMVSVIGLSENRFFSILLGSTFSAADLFCYAIGCIVFALFECAAVKKNKK